MVPLPLYAVFLIGVTYSALFEALLVRASTPCDRGRPATVLVNALLHVCVHVIGLHTLVTTQACNWGLVLLTDLCQGRKIRCTDSPLINYLKQYICKYFAYFMHAAIYV